MFGGDEWLIIAVIALVLFGGSQLPKLARNLGEAQREFKRSMRDDPPDDSSGTTVPPVPPAATDRTEKPPPDD